MPYFDITDDAGMLTKKAAQHEDIELLVERAEEDIFDYYRESPGNILGTPLVAASQVTLVRENITLQNTGPRVMLTYYKDDPTQLTTAPEIQFHRDVKRAIVRLVEIRITNGQQPLNVKSQRRGKRRIEYFRPTVDPQTTIPSSVRNILSKYDDRTPV